MKNLDNKNNEIYQRLKDCFTTLSLQFITALKYPRILRQAVCTVNIISILQNNKDLLNYLKSDTQKELSSVLQRFGSKSVEALKQQPHKSEEIIALTNSLLRLIEFLDSTSNFIEKDQSINKLKQEEIDLAEYFIVQCCALISGDRDQNAVNNFQVMAIIINLDYLSEEQKKLLLQQLLLIKELWQIDGTINIEKESVVINFHKKILSILKTDKVDDYNIILQKMLQFLLKDNNVLIELSNAKLVRLYDRLKDLYTRYDIDNVLLKIYKESKFRVSHSKFYNSGYDLLKLFECYNTILHQIENAEFAIVEKFLLKRNSFQHEILINITKHIDFIMIVDVANDVNLDYTLNQVRRELTQNIQNGHTISLMISFIESKLACHTSSMIITRYNSLDDFAKNRLKKRYELLFKNIVSLLTTDSIHKILIQNAIIYKIASKYKQNINTDSSLELRIIDKERLEIVRQLNEINFVEIFNDKYLNKISSLNFKKYVRKIMSETPLAYIKLIIRILSNNFTVEQLGVLLELSITTKSENIKSIVKHELILQLKKRLSFAKILYYIFARKNYELAKLNHIKRSINECVN
ncbi:MAG: hypothetical protein LN588_04605 [Rickettsia endosymbiont of Bryobia graminum]|nr:hypothetical protein [Rickettsia endosymbiont of Bryobia graminum]